eukprot:CAMPEP_0170969540 /NCGR_PEP_ID=MMETSP0735-20130129/44024_1 /TAXON_ID=186038 /ORGANISM="Fragilariopsis kerguelensis, Strain L26-C5" /LENGTH=656 /DNA_ID=CAMNT_0011388999 /DNA_START=42 /DNA_END=2012 /DNA_ORIENTATION=-
MATHRRPVNNPFANRVGAGPNRRSVGYTDHRYGGNNQNPQNRGRRGFLFSPLCCILTIFGIISVFYGFPSSQSYQYNDYQNNDSLLKVKTDNAATDERRTTDQSKIKNSHQQNEHPKSNTESYDEIGSKVEKEELKFATSEEEEKENESIIKLDHEYDLEKVESMDEEEKSEEEDRDEGIDADYHEDESEEIEEEEDINDKFQEIIGIKEDSQFKGRMSEDSEEKNEEEDDTNEKFQQIIEEKDDNLVDGHNVEYNGNESDENHIETPNDNFREINEDIAEIETEGVNKEHHGKETVEVIKRNETEINITNVSYPEIVIGENKEEDDDEKDEYSKIHQQKDETVVDEKENEEGEGRAGIDTNKEDNKAVIVDLPEQKRNDTAVNDPPFSASDSDVNHTAIDNSTSNDTSTTSTRNDNITNNLNMSESTVVSSAVEQNDTNTNIHMDGDDIVTKNGKIRPTLLIPMLSLTKNDLPGVINDTVTDIVESINPLTNEMEATNTTTNASNNALQFSSVSPLTIKTTTNSSIRFDNDSNISVNDTTSEPSTNETKSNFTSIFTSTVMDDNIAGNVINMTDIQNDDASFFNDTDNKTTIASTNHTTTSIAYGKSKIGVNDISTTNYTSGGNNTSLPETEAPMTSEDNHLDTNKNGNLRGSMA